MKPTAFRPALLALCLAAAPGLAQVPPTPPEGGAAAEPTPGSGQARREAQPPSGPLVPSPLPSAGEADARAQPGAPVAPSAANSRLPQLGVGTLNLDALAAGGVDAALDPTAAVAALGRAPRTEQDAALADLRTRVDATRRALLELRARARAQGVQVDSATQGRLEADLEEQEEALKRTLGTAPVAPTDDEWQRLQAEVAAQYEAFANAVRRVQQNLQSHEAQTPAER